MRSRCSELESQPSPQVWLESRLRKIDEVLAPVTGYQTQRCKSHSPACGFHAEPLAAVSRRITVGDNPASDSRHQACSRPLVSIKRTLRPPSPLRLLLSLVATGEKTTSVGVKINKAFAFTNHLVIALGESIKSVGNSSRLALVHADALVSRLGDYMRLN